MVKEQILANLKEDDYSPYVDGQAELTDEDWQWIADQVGQLIDFDRCGSIYTLDGLNRHRENVSPSKWQKGGK